MRSRLLGSAALLPLRGCELRHNSIQTGLLGLCDPAPLKERRLTNWFKAICFLDYQIYWQLKEFCSNVRPKCKVPRMHKQMNSDRRKDDASQLSWTGSHIDLLLPTELYSLNWNCSRLWQYMYIYCGHLHQFCHQGDAKKQQVGDRKLVAQSKLATDFLWLLAVNS